MNDIKTICPLTQRTLQKSCPKCNFVVVENGKIIGCAIKKNIRNVINNTHLAKEILDSFINFKENMKIKDGKKY